MTGRPAPNPEERAKTARPGGPGILGMRVGVKARSEFLRGHGQGVQGRRASAHQFAKPCGGRFVKALRNDNRVVWPQFHNHWAFFCGGLRPSDGLRQVDENLGSTYYCAARNHVLNRK